jgi:HNH endonuclease
MARPVRETPEQRFWRKVAKTEGGCWIWLASLTGNGYGKFAACAGSRRKKWVQAHRYAYELLKGPIPEGFDLHHAVCETKRCVNPDHTVPLSHSEHCKISAQNLTNKTHCPKGHPYAGENLYLTRNGFRQCRKCMKKSKREWKRRAQGLC